jgi:hypothetical protein
MKSPLKTGLLKPIKVPEALPDIKVYWVEVAESNNNEEVAASLGKLDRVKVAEELVAPMPTWSAEVIKET